MYKAQQVIVITGPTASGKSALALKVATSLPIEVVNIDSRQVYRELNIGVDKPTADQRTQIPHHLYDVVSIADDFNVAQYLQLADQVVKDIWARGKTPVLVGGTGLYIKAFLFGLFEIPPIDPSIRESLEMRFDSGALPAMYQELESIDPESAQRIHPNDPVRILRALEVFKSTGKSLTQWQSEHGFSKARYEYAKLAPKVAREVLYDRINKRVMEMCAGGLEEEARTLYARFPENSVLNKTIGYVEWVDYFKGTQSLDKTIELIQQHSRQYAKRQLTWFNKEEDIEWVEEDYKKFVDNLRNSQDDKG